MSIESVYLRQINGIRPYQAYSLPDLVERIVYQNDRHALDEFHNHRTLFHFKNENQLLFAQYVDRHRESAINTNSHAPNAEELADIAYNLTIDKFTNLPADVNSDQRIYQNTDQIVKQKGSDCRYYFSAFLRRIQKVFQSNPSISNLEREAISAKLMQGLVRRHFQFSLQEARRKSNPLWSKYYWQKGGRKFSVWLPVSIKGKKRGEWLEKHIKDFDPDRPSEKQRIQTIINRAFSNIRIVPFNDDEASDVVNFYPYLEENRSTGIPLSKLVAEEKAENIEKQRRSIKNLGPERLKGLVLKIFEYISCDEAKDSFLAKEYGLSKATFSRFAGSRWKGDEASKIPDLWLNTAHVLSNHPAFKEIYRNTDIWQQVTSILKHNQTMRK